MCFSPPMVILVYYGVQAIPLIPDLGMTKDVFTAVILSDIGHTVAPC